MAEHSNNDHIKNLYFCQISVRTLARILAGMSMIPFIVITPLALLFGNFPLHGFNWLLFIFYQLIFVLVLIADQFEQPIFYLPFLIYVCESIIKLFYWIIGCIALIFWPNSVKDNVFDDIRNVSHEILGISIIVMIIIVLYQFYTFIIVKEAFMFMKKDKKFRKLCQRSSEYETTPLLA